MPFEFNEATVKHPRLGQVEITHWSKFTPAEILSEIHRVEHDPSQIRHSSLNSEARVYHGQLGKHAVSIRAYEPNRDDQPSDQAPTTIFDRLKRSVSAKKTLLEVPVALVTDSKIDESSGRSKQYLLTIWKNGSPLVTHLTTNSIPLEEKIRLMKSHVDQVAKLHLKGYTHGHPHFGNSLLRNGKISLLDPNQAHEGLDGKLDDFKQLNSAVTTLASWLEKNQHLHPEKSAQMKTEMKAYIREKIYP